MKITLICPKGEYDRLSEITFFKWPPYGLIHLESLTPPEWEVKIIDEKEEPIDFNEPTDLVGLTATIDSAFRAYQIADEFKRRGIKTIMGGSHASIFPDEALEHVDSVVIGEADIIWSEILDDFFKSMLKRKYTAVQPKNLDILPRRKIKMTFPLPGFLRPIPIKFAYLQTSRGCPHGCDFCFVTMFNGRQIRSKSIPFLIDEIKHEKEQGMKYIVFVDDNIMANKSYAKQLFREMKSLKIHWMSQTDIRIADEDVIDIAKESGLVAAYLGLESINSSTLRESVCQAKNYWRPQYEKAIKDLRRRGIIVEAAFVFGFDNESKNTIRETIDWAIKNKVDLAQFSILTPLPGTKLFERLLKDGRIKTKNWNRYFFLNCVYKPLGEWTGENLEKEVRNAYKRFYSFPSIIRRINLRVPFLHNVYNIICNIEFRRLAKDKS